MKKLALTLALVAALGAVATAQPYPRDDVRRYDDRNIYRDNRGEYHWQVVERRVWVPTQRIGSGIFGRVIPGHYEVRRDRVKVYHGRGRHPHGMPPGQRKKYYDRDDRRWNDRDDDRWDDRDERWERDRRDDRRWNNDYRG
ncbi:hypothetical protein [Pedobacter sp. SYSU D00535]|uniref:hypothetical protein n=1 Tax=Pedobacter sp. SYSU D00535 TaxID=2810308 RepID=UPI001A95D91C|nr:hypothetical protein [Pedobacter sp. SYSU D00535]